MPANAAHHARDGRGRRRYACVKCTVATAESESSGAATATSARPKTGWSTPLIRAGYQSAPAPSRANQPFSRRVRSRSQSAA